MQPFYSIEDLVCMFEIYSPENIADALLASGVKLVHGGIDADVTQWRHQRPGKASDGAIVVMRGLVLDPDPDEVMVAYESLPASWKQRIDQHEGQGTEPLRDPEVMPTVVDTLSTRRERTLLRIVRALLKMVPNLPDRGASVPIEAQLLSMGFTSPRDETIAKAIRAARDLEPDQPPN